MLRHVSVLGPSSGSYIVLAKVTQLKVILISLFQLVLWQHAVLYCVTMSVLLQMCVPSVTGHSWQHNTTQHAATKPTGIVKLI